MKTITIKTLTATLGIMLCGIYAQATITDALKVKVTNGSATDETVIRFVSGATTAFDGSWDAYKMFSSSPTVPAAFTKIDPVSPASINALPSLTGFTDVELFFHIKVAGTYTLQAIELGAFAASTKIILEDKSDGSLYYFRNGASVSFPLTVNTVGAASRFVVHFRPVETAVSSSRLEEASAAAIDVNTDNSDTEQASETLRSAEVTATQENPLKTYLQDGAIMINGTFESQAAVTIMIYNMSGQLVYSFSASATQGLSESAILKTSGTYIVQSLINNKMNSQKINYIK